MTAKSETKKIPFNLNSIAEKILNDHYFINAFIESPFDVYLVLQNEEINNGLSKKFNKNNHPLNPQCSHEIYKSMNQTFNSPDFNMVESFNCLTECQLWIDSDIEYSKKVVES